MKYFLALFFAFFSLFLNAQTVRISTQNSNNIEVTDSLWYTPAEYTNHVFGNLNLQEITTNFLLQRSLSYFDPYAYDGKNGNDSTIRSAAHGISIYTTLYYSALDTAASYALAHPSLLRSSQQNFKQQNRVPIVLINRSYQSIKNTALLDGLFTTNPDSTALYDNTSRTVSPYEKHRLFAAFAYTSSRSYSSNGDVVFSILPNVFHFTDTLSGQLEIDFGDGKGYVNLTPGTTKSVYYSSSGEKIIKVKQGGLESISIFNFIKKDVFYEPVVAEPPIEGLQMKNSTFSVSQPIISKFLGCDKVLDKPIVVVEGFNIEEDYPADEILGSLNRAGLVDRLYALGYDFVVVKFSQNTASITDNAMALRSAINTINAEKAGNNKLHVVGLSMGGLITKYCLKDMEDNGLTHNVENYFSYDAPHQGAYAPIGLQLLIYHASHAVRDIRNNPLVKEILDKMASPAGQQLLQVQMSASQSTPLRNSFASSYAAKGYPALCHNYGIANGLGDGTGLNYPGGAQLMHFYGYAKVAILGKVLKHTQQFWATNTSQSLVANFSNKGFAAVLGLQGLKSHSVVARYTGEMVHETLPGSIVSMHPKYGNGLADNFRTLGGEEHDYFGRLNTSFVPTVSALDLNNQNYSANNFYVSRNPYYNIAANHSAVLSNHITPFEDIIYSVDENQEHLFADYRISNFIFQKIYGSAMPTGCNGLCSSTPTFSGLSNICGTEATITMSNAPSGVIINWVLPASLEIVSGQGTNMIKVRPTTAGTFSGYVTLTWPGCTSSNYSFNVTFTQPAAAISGPTQICENSGYYTISNLPAGATVTWNNTLNGIATVSGSGGSITLTPNNTVDNGPITLQATVTTNCGTLTLPSKTVYIGVPDPLPLSVTIYPTPGSDGLSTQGTYTLTAPAAAAGLTYKWEFIEEVDIIDIIHPASNQITFAPRYPGGSISVVLSYTNGCATLWEDFYQVKDDSPWGFTYYPNPTSSSLTVGQKQLNINQQRSVKSDQNTPAKKAYSIKLFDHNARVLAEGTSSSGEDISINTSNIPNGTYFLHIFQDKTVIKKQVIVRH